MEFCAYMVGIQAWRKYRCNHSMVQHLQTHVDSIVGISCDCMDLSQKGKSYENLIIQYVYRIPLGKPELSVKLSAIYI